MNDEKADVTWPYLHVMPRYVAGQRWHVFEISDEPPLISIAASVASYVEARTLAAQDQRPLRIAGRAWQQMVAAGVAPATVPDDVTVV